MAKLSLATRAARYGHLLSSTPDTLSQKNRGERDKLLRAIGVSPEQWSSYAPSTRRKYLAAAKRGNTASVERARVREQRKARSQRTRSPDISKRTEIEQLRQKLIQEGMDTNRGFDTETDELDSDILLSREAIDDHIRYYGIDYVLRHLRDQWDSVDFYLRNDRNPGNTRWRRWKAFAASPKYRGSEDERWFWYHTSSFTDVYKG